MKDDRGFSLIELIIVMVIMGVIVIGSMTGYKMLGSQHITSTVKRINAELDYVQVQSMTKNKKYYLVIEKKFSDGNYYLSVQTENGAFREIQSEKKLDLKDGQITFINKGTTDAILVNSTSPTDSIKLEVSFKKESGGIMMNSFGKIISNIGVSASARAYSIRLVEITGKHYIE